MNARIIRTTAELHALESVWDALSADSVYQSPFHSWTWYDAWWRHFGAAGENELFLIALEGTDGRLEAVAPFMKGPRSFRGLKATEVRFIANSISPESNILHRRDVPAAAALAAVVECLSEHRDEWDLFMLWNVPESAGYLPDMQNTVARHGFQLLCEPGWQSAAVNLNGDFEHYLSANLHKDRRRGIRQKVRQMTERPGYRVLEFQRPDEIDRAVELALCVSHSSWKGPLGTDMGGSPQRRGFYEEISRRLAQRGQLQITIAMLDDTPLALQYQLVDRDSRYLILNDFNAAFHNQSPGTVLLYQVLERLFAEKPVARFQFSGDLYDYKSKWATEIRSHRVCEVYADRLYPRLLCWAKQTALPAVRSWRARIRHPWASQST